MKLDYDAHVMARKPNNKLEELQQPLSQSPLFAIGKARRDDTPEGYLSELICKHNDAQCAEPLDSVYAFIALAYSRIGIPVALWPDYERMCTTYFGMCSRSVGYGTIFT